MARLTLKLDYKPLWEDGLYSDVVVVIGDNKKKLHRAILTCHSRVFESAFALDQKSTEIPSGGEDHASTMLVLESFYNHELVLPDNPLKVVNLMREVIRLDVVDKSVLNGLADHLLSLPVTLDSVPILLGLRVQKLSLPPEKMKKLVDNLNFCLESSDAADVMAKFAASMTGEINELLSIEFEKTKKWKISDIIPCLLHFCRSASTDPKSLANYFRNRLPFNNVLDLLDLHASGIYSCVGVTEGDILSSIRLAHHYAALRAPLSCTPFLPPVFSKEAKGERKEADPLGCPVLLIRKPNPLDSPAATFAHFIYQLVPEGISYWSFYCHSWTVTSQALIGVVSNTAISRMVDRTPAECDAHCCFFGCYSLGIWYNNTRNRILKKDPPKFAEKDWVHMCVTHKNDNAVVTYLLPGAAEWQEGRQWTVQGPLYVAVGLGIETAIHCYSKLMI